MKLSSDKNPAKDLNIKIFLTFVGIMSDCPVLLNHKSDMMTRMKHLVNMVSNNGIDWTVHERKRKHIKIKFNR